MNEKLKVLESILFLKGRTGETVEQLSKILKSPKKDIESLIEELKISLSENENSIYKINKTSDKVRISLKDEVTKLLDDKIDRTVSVRLSKSVVETLTLIAYNQPFTKPQIEKLRGVASDYAVRKLLDYDLIEDLGHSDLPGQPKLYGTTDEFLQLFNLENTSELPNIEEKLEEQTNEMVALFERE